MYAKNKLYSPLHRTCFVGLISCAGVSGSGCIIHVCIIHVCIIHVCIIHVCIIHVYTVHVYMFLNER